MSLPVVVAHRCLKCCNRRRRLVDWSSIDLDLVLLEGRMGCGSVHSWCMNAFELARLCSKGRNVRVICWLVDEVRMEVDLFEWSRYSPVDSKVGWIGMEGIRLTRRSLV